jgi:hypothetical protein
MALWVTVLASPVTLKRSPKRWWVIVGLFVGLLAAAVGFGSWEAMA